MTKTMESLALKALPQGSNLAKACFVVWFW
jgi:hypothetical protein